MKAFNFMYDRGTIEKGRHTFDQIGKYVKHFQLVTRNNLQEDAGLFFTNLNWVQFKAIRPSIGLK